MKKVVWKGTSLGREYDTSSINNEMLGEMQEKRNNLIDKLGDVNDELAEKIIKSESYEKIPTDVIIKAIRNATCNQQIVPVFLGSAYKNIGVQPLMDGVLNFLPAPEERNTVYNCFG